MKIGKIACVVGGATALQIKAGAANTEQLTLKKDNYQMVLGKAVNLREGDVKLKRAQWDDETGTVVWQVTNICRANGMHGVEKDNVLFAESHKDVTIDGSGKLTKDNLSFWVYHLTFTQNPAVDAPKDHEQCVSTPNAALSDNEFIVNGSTVTFDNATEEQLEAYIAEMEAAQRLAEIELQEEQRLLREAQIAAQRLEEQLEEEERARASEIELQEERRLLREAQQAAQRLEEQLEIRALIEREAAIREEEALLLEAEAAVVAQEKALRQRIIEQARVKVA